MIINATESIIRGVFFCMNVELNPDRGGTVTGAATVIFPLNSASHAGFRDIDVACGTDDVVFGEKGGYPPFILQDWCFVSILTLFGIAGSHRQGSVCLPLRCRTIIFKKRYSTKNSKFTREDRDS